MTTFQIAGFIIFIGGMVPYAIGSLIHIAHNPEALDLSFRINPWPSWPYGWVELTHPKARWWCGVGFPICLAGFIVLLVATIALVDLALYVALLVAFFWLRRVTARRRRH
ncbi:hypothetical protein [Mesorhizobium sp. M0220]|uniref:hypothetical protein n=1 Tax=unclassified Mesorhizobium TaxID=325217 RepID=UPI0033371661